MPLDVAFDLGGHQLIKRLAMKCPVPDGPARPIALDRKEAMLGRKARRIQRMPRAIQDREVRLDPQLAASRPLTLNDRFVVPVRRERTRQRRRATQSLDCGTSDPGRMSG